MADTKWGQLRTWKKEIRLRQTGAEDEGARERFGRLLEIIEWHLDACLVMPNQSYTDQLLEELQRGYVTLTIP